MSLKASEVCYGTLEEKQHPGGQGRQSQQRNNIKITLKSCMAFHLLYNAVLLCSDLSHAIWINMITVHLLQSDNMFKSA